MSRERDLKQQGFTLRTLWECDLRIQLQCNPAMKTFFGESKSVMPLDPREAFYGGRTCSLRMLCTPGADEYVGYVDICSLYPWVCKYSEFPVGHPTIITENFKPISDTEHPYFGIVKCSVVPPRGLFHPVLPMKGNGKLLFTLCSKCALEESKETCAHGDETRAISGAWCTPELYKVCL